MGKFKTIIKLCKNAYKQAKRLINQYFFGKLLP